MDKNLKEEHFKKCNDKSLNFIEINNYDSIEEIEEITYLNSGNDSVFLPCEFCTNFFSSIILIDHQVKL